MRPAELRQEQEARYKEDLRWFGVAGGLPTKINSSSVIFPTERLSYQQLFSQAGPKFLRTFTQ
jgi:hypothetical protein